MKAFILDGYGSADHVRAGDVPDPQLREDDVLIQAHAAGINLLDSKIRNGEFKRILPYRLPLILRHDIAGIVIRVGSQVRFPFASTQAAMAHVESGRAKGKVVVSLR
jgi:NADPH:quinone reductase-like Zn-dependent oxidoreductase